MNNHRILIVSGDDSRTRSLISFLSGLDLEIERTTACPKPSSLAGPAPGSLFSSFRRPAEGTRRSRS